MRRKIVCAVGAVLLLASGAGALAAQGTIVVPPTGKAAGHGYAFWMQRHWQFAFGLVASSAASSNPCKTLTGSGTQHIAFLSGPFNSGTHACTVPAGRPIYVNVASVVCDSFKAADHPGFGTSDAQLQLCAKKYLGTAGTPSATVDGRAVNVKALLAATGAFPVHAVAGNPIGVPAGNGRAASVGYGLLLSGFSSGDHTIHWIVRGSAGANITYTVHVS